MRIIRNGQAVTDHHFTGSVEQTPVIEYLHPKSVRVSTLTFQPASRTYWHLHRGGQILFIIDGAGEAQCRGGEIEQLSPGDVVLVGSSEEHWHGAATASSMTHMSVAIDEVDWTEAVDR